MSLLLPLNDPETELSTRDRPRTSQGKSLLHLDPSLLAVAVRDATRDGVASPRPYLPLHPQFHLISRGRREVGVTLSPPTPGVGLLPTPLQVKGVDGC